MVITCSDTRTPETTPAATCIMHMLKDAGHSVVAYHLVKDEPSKIKAKIKAAVTNKKIHAIIINGAPHFETGSTFERWMRCWKSDCGIARFSLLTYQEIGSPAIMSAPQPASSKAACSLNPGSENAVRLAMEKLILPELGHLVKELIK